MARFVKGDIVLVPFPFSAEEAYKHRPALVMASWSYAGGTDYLVALITTQPAPDPYLTEIVQADTYGGSLAQSGSLVQRCYLRPTYLFAPDEQLISRRLDRLKPEKLAQVIQTVVRVLTA